LWAYACISLILIYWREGPFSYRAFWIGIAIVLALGFEVGQLLNIVPGTFCVYDLMFSIAAIGLALSKEVRHTIPIRKRLTTNPGILGRGGYE
jgi:hypothetical protein